VRTYRIAVLPGDGIGPEVTAEAVQTLRAVAGDFRLERQEFSVGAAEYRKSGDPLPPETFEAVKGFDAILLGAMGLPDVRWPNGTEMAPQLDLREKLELYAGVRPVRLYHQNDTPLKGRQAGSIDFVIFRENTEGMFWSRKGSLRSDEGEVVDGLRISRRGSERLFRAAFREAQKRRGRITLVDKSNVLPSMAYFRRIFEEVGEEFPGVRREKVYVDAAALYLVQRPQAFDVLVTENLFGDILSDLAAGLVGGMGMAPSGDIGDRWAVFQPSHGSAPDIAGQGVANPTATILSAAMMLEWLGEHKAAERIRGAVERVFADPGLRTRDLGGKLGTTELGARIREGL
jgi:3-isopropylmalate dehydrogenase